MHLNSGKLCMHTVCTSQKIKSDLKLMTQTNTLTDHFIRRSCKNYVQIQISKGVYVNSRNESEIRF